MNWKVGRRHAGGSDKGVEDDRPGRAGLLQILESKDEWGGRGRACCGPPVPSGYFAGDKDGLLIC